LVIGDVVGWSLDARFSQFIADYQELNLP